MIQLAQPQNTRGVSVPASIGGINSIDSLAAMQPTDSVYCLNLLSSEYGLRTREGYAEYSEVIPDTVDVRTILGYRGTADDGSLDRLFVVTDNGIYDLADPEDPTELIQFGTTTGNAGWGVSTTFVTIGGSYMFYADEVNGGFRYEEDTDTWEAIPDLTLGGSPYSPTDIVHVGVWKNRIWFTIRDTSVAYYLPVGQVSGALTAFDFGPKFTYGGSLVGVWSWTVEGGAGMNDYLVALSRGGDALVYQGIDPSNANSFGIKGSFYLGSFPAGRDFVTNYAGDLLVITEFGVLQMSKILQGIEISENRAYLSARIYRFFREWMSDGGKDRFGWCILQHPRLGYLMVVVPKRPGSDYVQFVRSGNTGAWTIYQGIPVNCIDEYLGEIYFGTQLDDGKKVYRMTGDLDDGDPITWSLLTSYQPYSDPTRFKRAQIIRPTFIGPIMPVYDVQARYDFDLQTVIGSPSIQDAGLGVWDTGIWDQALWGGEWVTESKPFGANGMGRSIAVALRGSSVVSSTLVSMDLMYDVGGML